MNWIKLIDVNLKGAYSLVLAKLGFKVLAIEAFYDNILRIRKASYLEKTYHNLVLVHNALSNKRNEIKMLQPHENIGAQSLLPHHNEHFTKNKTNKYLVETILFDDIVPYLPFKNDRNERFQKAILKIDIEGFEPFALQHAHHLFDTLDIFIIFMEWYNIQKLEPKLVEELIEFFTKRNYVLYDDAGRLLPTNQWKATKSFNVEWRRSNSIIKNII